MLIDDFLPSFHFSEISLAVVDESPGVVFNTVRNCDLGRSTVVRRLFQLRGLPRCEIAREGLQEIGFKLLGVHEDKEIIIGIIGRFWSLSSGLMEFDADYIAAFN